jgi:hypothetical protein
VMATGASIAPYIHFELGQPIHIDYVWGRQIGENTIDPQSAGRTSGVRGLTALQYGLGPTAALTEMECSSFCVG